MEIGPLLIVCIFAIAVISALYYFGMRLARAIERKAPESEVAAKVTPTGLALCGCVTALLVLFLTAAKLKPDGPLGSFVRSSEGLMAALVGTVAFFSGAAWFFERIGYPIVRRGKSGSK
jgi:hypothetical protein